MEKKTYTQSGKFSIMVLLPLFIISLVLIVTAGLNNLILGVTFGFLAITFLVCLLIFYKLTVSIDNIHLSFRLGVGMVSGKYLIADIRSCIPVKNDPLYGIGIRLIPNGWLYNVSGLQAIELTFKNRNTKIRIGTDKPEEIASVINRMIDNTNSESTRVYEGKSRFLIVLTIIIIILVLPVGITLSGKREIKVDLLADRLSVNGIYGLSVKYSDIRELDTISSLPKISRRTNGYAFGRTLKGNFTLADRTKVKLFIMNRTPPYINIKTDDLNLYLNFNNPGKTVNLYNSLAGTILER